MTTYTRERRPGPALLALAVSLTVVALVTAQQQPPPKPVPQQPDEVGARIAGGDVTPPAR